MPGSSDAGLEKSKPLMLVPPILTLLQPKDPDMASHVGWNFYINFKLPLPWHLRYALQVAAHSTVGWFTGLKILQDQLQPNRFLSPLFGISPEILLQSQLGLLG
jgi:hypothetical protein